jgi:hypothetical protein
VKSVYLLLGTLCIAGCSGDGPSAAPSPARPVVSGVRHTLSGTVRDPHGQPIQAAALGVIQPQPTNHLAGGFVDRDAHGVSDVHGDYSMSVPHGSFHLFVGHPSFRDIGRSVNILTNTSLDLTLVPSVNLTGRVSAPGAKCLNDPVVEIVSGPDAGRSMISRGGGADWHYFFHDLVPGPLTVRVRKCGYDPVEQRVDVTADATLDFTLKAN